MLFEEKVKFLRTLPQFKVIPISEVRAVAFAAKEINEKTSEEYLIPNSNLYLTRDDIQKIVRTYPDLATKFN